MILQNHIVIHLEKSKFIRGSYQRILLILKNGNSILVMYNVYNDRKYQIHI